MMMNSKNPYNITKMKNRSLIFFKDGAVCRFFAFLMFFGISGNVVAEKISDKDAANRIFMRSFGRNLAVGEKMRKILQIAPNDMSLTQEELLNITRETQRLPVAEKCRIFLLTFIVFMIDGENGERLGDGLGNDIAIVGKILAEIPDESLKKACRNLGLSEKKVEGRARLFRILVKEWSSRKIDHP